MESLVVLFVAFVSGAAAVAFRYPNAWRRLDMQAVPFLQNVALIAYGGAFASILPQVGIDGAGVRDTFIVMFALSFGALVVHAAINWIRES